MLFYYYLCVSFQVWWSAEDVLRDAFSEEGTYPVRVFMLKNEARDGTTGEIFIGIKDIIFRSGTIVFSWNINIQFFPKYVMFSHILCLVERCLNYDML